jgi:hypothetical protein
VATTHVFDLYIAIAHIAGSTGSAQTSGTGPGTRTSRQHRYLLLAILRKTDCTIRIQRPAASDSADDSESGEPPCSESFVTPSSDTSKHIPCHKTVHARSAEPTIRARTVVQNDDNTST